MILETRETTLNVDLDDVDVVADAAEHALVIDLDPIAADFLGFAQIAQQSAVAATEVEDALPFGNPVGDDGKVETLALFGRKVLIEMFSR